MKFTILDRFGNTPSNAKNEIFLVWDDWNDYDYYTLFGVFYIDSSGVKHELANVKIGCFGQDKSERIYKVGHTFTNIGESYFSVGTSEEYYELLKSLGSEVRIAVLIGLNDIASDVGLFSKVEDEPVVVNSFFRFLSPSTVTGQFRRMANGGAKLTPYSFNFIQQHPHDQSLSAKLDFNVYPDSFPPTNVHVLIGRNGVGKTYLINNMIDSLLKPGDIPPGEGVNGFVFVENEDLEESQTFANLISVSFSAFDEMDPRSEDSGITSGIRYSYIGLKRQPDEGKTSQSLKESAELQDEFVISLAECKSRGVIERWKRALFTLESDPNFKRVGIVELIELAKSAQSKAIISEKFKMLSSGHKIVLLTITKLIERLQERTLLIMDEPETHLHPPLLSAFIRAISDLMIEMNGVSIVATHSPVILQEVPRTCAWKLNLSGIILVADRPEQETFGENVGILTNDVFRLETTESGFYAMLLRVIKDTNYDYDAVLEKFDYQLGMEARSIVMAEIASKENEK